MDRLAAPLADRFSSSTFAGELDAVRPVKVKKAPPVPELYGPGKLSISVVLAVPAPLVPPPVLGVPVPVMSIPTPEIVIPEVQAQGEPVVGMIIVSPFTAVCVGPLMTAFTSDRLHEAAV
jgi:hypothetical protein